MSDATRPAVLGAGPAVRGARPTVRGTFGRANGARGPRQLLPDHLRRNADKLLERLARTVKPFRMRQAAYNFWR